MATKVVVEVLLALGADGAELVLVVLLDDAGVDEVAHEYGSAMVVLALVLGLLQLVLQLLDLGGPGSVCVLLVELGLLIVLDLLLGAPSLALGLHQVCADAVLD